MQENANQKLDANQKLELSSTPIPFEQGLILTQDK
jgi:hypothetical protein